VKSSTKCEPFTQSVNAGINLPPFLLPTRFHFLGRPTPNKYLVRNTPYERGVFKSETSTLSGGISGKRISLPLPLGLRSLPTNQQPSPLDLFNTPTFLKFCSILIVRFIELHCRLETFNTNRKKISVTAIILTVH